MVKITNDYVAGFLENIGCFYVLNKNPQFKINIQKHTYRYPIMEKIELFLKEKHSIIFSPWEDEKKKVYQITSQKMLLRLIWFIEEFCFSKKRNQEDTKNLILTKRGQTL